MFKNAAFVTLAATLATAGCSGSSATGGTPLGGMGGASATAGAGGSNSLTAGGVGGASGGSTSLTAGGGNGGSNSLTAGGGAGGVAGSSGATGMSGTGGSGGTSGMNGMSGGGGMGGTGGVGATGGSGGFGGGMSTVPGDYSGTPFTALSIPGKIDTEDYDHGGPGVAWCHNAGNCGAHTSDNPGGSPLYRPADDDIGICWMNPGKPDNTITGQPMPTDDAYLCYSEAGEWTKYTVYVVEAGTYSVGGVMASMLSQAGFNLSFGDGITTGDIAVAVTPNDMSGSGENYHSWADRSNLATVTFPSAGTYLMTFTQVERFNASSFTFTKM